MKYRVLALLIPSLLSASTIQTGWEQLIRNQPDSALTTFRSANAATPQEQAAALRGEIATLAYLSGTDTLAAKSAMAFKLDSDPTLFAAHLGYLLSWSREGIHHADKQILKELYRASAQQTCMTPLFNEVIMSKEISRGKVKKAAAIKAQTGSITEWKFIGPFDNSAGGGFHSAFAPEQALLQPTPIMGKDRNLVSWYPMKSISPDPWVWLNNHAEGYNSVYYFAVSIHSAIDQAGWVSFGASGNFKLFQNSALILQDSLFRNTGLNSYLTRINLKQGVNTFLVKIGYEEQKANFAFALLNSTFSAFDNITVLSELVDRREPASPLQHSTRFMIDSIDGDLANRSSAQTTSYESIQARIAFLIIQDQNSDAERLIRQELKKHPQSGLLLSQLADVLLRQGRVTEAGQVYRQAFEYSPQGNAQWQYELNRLSDENNRDALQKFLDESAPHHKKSAEWLMARMALYAQSEKTAQAMALLDSLAQQFPESPTVAVVRHSIYAEGGQVVDAREVLERVLKKNPYNQTITYMLGDYLTRTGNISEALDLYLKEIERRPESPRAYYLTASLLTAHKQLAAALPYIERVLALTPNSSYGYRLKGQILQQMGNKDSALACYKKAVDVTTDDFVAWESQRELEGKPSWQALAPIPPIDSIMPKALYWADSVGEAVTVLSYYDDIIRYPSKASRTRTYFVVHLADRKAIEEWQEYVIGSGRPEGLTILQALTLKKDGRKIPADRNDAHLVFKSLEPGDNILVEYTQEERTGAGMTGMIYGEQKFSSPIPAYQQNLRFITPVDDTLPYRVSGMVPTPTTRIDDGFRITEFQADREKSVSSDDQFLPDDYKGMNKVIYSDFTSWNQIARWYNQLSAQKGEINATIQAIADSLFAGITDDGEKIRRTHHYITKNIAYSFVPFRQSGWIPQSTSEILATKIGDCKDMALLGRTLLRLGGISAELVLVNTGLAEYIDNAFIGPNFDHAILAASLNGEMKYIDLTSSNAAVDALPVADQGAMALLVTDSSQAPFMLPVDKAEDRTVTRSTEIVLSDDGSVVVKTDSEKSSVFATEMRNSYRFGSPRDRITYMQKLLQEESKSVTVDSLTFTGLDTLGKSVNYRTVYRIENGVSLGVNTALFRVPFAEQIRTSRFPAIASRTAPISLKKFWLWNSLQKGCVTITYPKTWKLSGKLEDQYIRFNDSYYSLKIKQEGNSITFTRDALLNFTGIYTVEEFKPIHEFMSKAMLADNIELIFNK